MCIFIVKPQYFEYTKQTKKIFQEQQLEIQPTTDPGRNFKLPKQTNNVTIFVGIFYKKYKNTKQQGTQKTNKQTNQPTAKES